MNLLFKLRAAWRFAQGISIPQNSSWNKENEAALAGFLNSVHGRKMVAALNSAILQQQFKATLSGHPVQCGIASGMQALMAQLHTLTISGQPDMPKPGKVASPQPAQEVPQEYAHLVP